MAAQELPLAQGLGHLQQQLGQVAADLALDADRHHDPLPVAALHPLGDPFERVLQRDAETGLDDDALELARDGLVALAHDRVDRLREREAGGEAARHQLQRVGQTGAEGAEPAGALEPQVEPGADRARRRRRGPRAGCCPTPIRMPEQAGADGDAGPQQQPLRRLQRHPCGVELGLQPGLEGPVVGQRLLGGLAGLAAEARAGGCRLALGRTRRWRRSRRPASAGPASPWCPAPACACRARG